MGDRKVGGYSGHMKRRRDLALAFAQRPCMLFLDEPTTGLEIHAPNFDDGFLAKSGRTPEASADDKASLDGDRQGQTAPEVAATAAA